MNTSPISLALSSAERSELLRLARDTIGAGLGVRQLPVLQLDTPALRTSSGAFVSLHSIGKLRGCVGRALASDPLYVTVSRMALASAFEDPRFDPLRPEEWNHLAIEISRLTPPCPAGPEDVVPGRHGVYVVCESVRGLLLPQVAERLGWTRERFLGETCRKAGLPLDAWKRAETQIFVFEAEVFGDEPR